MAKTIKEMANKYIYENCESDAQLFMVNHAFEAGANAVLEEIEDYLENYTLPKDSLLKFYILDVLADIGLYVKQLKGE